MSMGPPKDRVVFIDITEYKQAEKEKYAAELLIANKELAFQNNEKERIACIVTHC